LRVGSGEIDLLVRFGSALVAVEVKTRIGGDPLDQLTDEKERRLWESVRALGGVSRVDVVGVRLRTGGASVRWLQGIL
jgi:Holliday junction resolvase-like predicted endonuclease